MEVGISTPASGSASAASAAGRGGVSPAAQGGNGAFSSRFSGGLRCRVTVRSEEVVISGIVAAVCTPQPRGWLTASLMSVGVGLLQMEANSRSSTTAPFASPAAAGNVTY